MPYNPDYKIALSLYLVRHGYSKGNAGEGGCTAEEKEDPHLTETGFRQARLLGERFSRKAFDCIISSPLNRAIETAQPVCALQPEGGAGIIELHPLFCEVGLSEEYEGKTFGEINELYPNVTPAPGTENYDKFICHTGNSTPSKERAVKAIEYLTSRFTNGESVVLIAHGGFNRYLLEEAMNLDFEKSHSDPSFFNTGVTKINFYRHGEGIYGNDVTLEYMNDHSHLSEEMPMLSFRD